MSVATYDVVTDITACGVCKAGEHGRCRGGSCSCRRPGCERIRSMSIPVPKPTYRPTVQEVPVVPNVPTPPTIDVPVARKHFCTEDGCDYLGATEHGLAVHRARSHKIAGARNGVRSHAPARKAPAPTPPPSPEAPTVAVAQPSSSLEALVAAPGEWAEVGRIELATRDVDGRMGVFARFVPHDGTA